MNKSRLADTGEFGLIKHFIEKSKTGGIAYRPEVPVGDDAFAGALKRGLSIVASKDMLVEGIHFSSKWMSWHSIGRKAMLVNLSDLAAMGRVRPLYALVGCALPKTFAVKDALSLFEGLKEAAAEYKSAIVGGDTVSSNCGVVISVTVLGEAERGSLIKRSTAKIGDLIYTTGRLGYSALGLNLISGKFKPRILKRDYNTLAQSHINPKPGFKEAYFLADKKIATSMMDCSDGLAVCINEIASLSRVGAKLDVSLLAGDPLLAEVCGALKLDAKNICSCGGEDYTLIFTAHKSKKNIIRSKLPEAVEVGEIKERGFGVKYFNRGAEFKPRGGFDHFKTGI